MHLHKHRDGAEALFFVIILAIFRRAVPIGHARAHTRLERDSRGWGNVDPIPLTLVVIHV